MKRTGAFAYPQWVFFALAVLTPCTYIAAAGCVYYLGHYSRQFIPFPSTCVAGVPERYIFGTSAAIVTPLMALAAWRVYKHLKHPKFGRRSTLTNVLSYVCVAFGFAAATLYGVSSFWTVADGLWWHLAFHMGYLVSLACFFALYDFVSFKARGSLPTRVLVHDGLMIPVVVTYAGACYFILRRVMGITFSVWSASGYGAILLAFMRYYTLGWQITGAHTKKHN